MIEVRVGMGRKPLIQRETVIRAAIEIADADGPGSLSLERIAAALGVKAPSLYNHFSDKAEILAGVARSIVMETPRTPAPVGGDWKQWLIEASVRFRETLLKHSRAAPLVVEYFPRGLLEKLYAEHCLVLAAANVPTNYQMFILEATHRMTIGAAMCVATGRPAMAPFANPDQFDEQLNESMQQGNWSDAKLFTEMLRVFMDGAEADYSRRELQLDQPS